MTNDERRARNDKLNRLINELAESQEIFSDKKKYNYFYTKLRGIYLVGDSASFMHSHNELFSMLAELDSKGKLEILGQNMEVLYKHCLFKKDEEMKEAVYQLYDHVNLDIARINYIKVVDRRLETTGEDLKGKIEDAKVAAQKVQEITDSLTGTVEAMSNKVNNAYSEFVSILGIFSAIVLVVFGGTSIFGNIISNMKGTYIFKCIIMCLLTGIVIFDIIFMFIYFMPKIINRSIAATNEWLLWKPIGTRFRKRYPLIFYTNFLVFWAVYICAAIWVWHIVRDGYRDDILKLLNLFIDTGSYRSMIVFGLLYILLVSDLAFIIAYIVSRISDLNIGRRINLKILNEYAIYAVGDKFMVEDYFSPSAKEFKYRRNALAYMYFKNIESVILTGLYNFIKRVFFRYPYMVAINTGIAVSVLATILYKN